MIRQSAGELLYNSLLRHKGRNTVLSEVVNLLPRIELSFGGSQVDQGRFRADTFVNSVL
jgi:hypothetical protein